LIFIIGKFCRKIKYMLKLTFKKVLTFEKALTFEKVYSPISNLIHIINFIISQYQMSSTKLFLN